MTAISPKKDYRVTICQHHDRKLCYVVVYVILEGDQTHMSGPVMSRDRARKMAGQLAEKLGVVVQDFTA